MGICGDDITHNRRRISKGKPYIKYTYEIKNNDLVQIINNRGEKYINDEIESKIKILNDDNIEPLIFQKKFVETGINVVYFIIEEKINNMNYLFNKCNSLKKAEFFSFETIQATKTAGMFQLCKELEYLAITEFNTSNVINMANMFYACNKLKEIKGFNNFNTIKVTDMSGFLSDCKEL